MKHKIYFPYESEDYDKNKFGFMLDTTRANQKSGMIDEESGTETETNDK